MLKLFQTLHQSLIIIIPLFVFFFGTGTCFGQYVKGTVRSIDNQDLEYASVALLNPSDSVLVSFAYTDKQGKFEVNEIDTGKFLLHIYLGGYNPYFKEIVLQNKLLDLGVIILNDNFEQLDEITISAVIPVQIKNDTIAFNASSFKINHDDNIEDLLAKLPGLELSTDGTIRAYGNEITKLFVDGKEFFGGDPSIVLKNLSADIIKKIEVIDKKSDEAELTGLDDNYKTYVINFALKEQKKNRGFGKLAAGAGLDRKYFANLNYNLFSNKTQFSVIGKTNDINITGSNIQDFLTFTGGLSDEEDDSEQSSDKNVSKGLNGSLTTRVVGSNIGYEMAKKEVINTDYYYNYLNNKGTSTSTKTHYFSSYNHASESVTDNESTSKNHNINFNYENKRWKNSRLIIKGKFNSSELLTNSIRKTQFYGADDEQRTTSDTKYNNQLDRQQGNVNINFYKKLHSNKRNFGAGIRLQTFKNENIRDQFTENVNTSNRYKRTIQVLRNQDVKTDYSNFYLQYTEPLNVRHFLKIRIDFQNQKSTEQIYQNRVKNTYEDSTLNYSFKNLEESRKTTLTYNYNTPKFNLFFGTEVQQLTRIINLYKKRINKSNDLYWNPKFSIRYKPKKGSNYFLNYRKLIKSPRNNQISPIVDDLNPFYIRQGNPQLEIERIDNVDLNLTHHNFRSGLSLFSKLNYRHIDDAVIPSLLINDTFVRTRSYTNYGDQDRLNGLFNISNKWKSQPLRYGMNSSYNYSASSAIIENIVNDISSHSFMLGAYLENSKKNKIDAKIGLNYTKTRTEFSIDDGLNRNYGKQQYYFKFDYDVTQRFNFSTQFDYFHYSDSDFQTNYNTPIWNSSISYTVSKNNSAVLKFLIIDLLDRNIDIVKRSTVNFFEETTNIMLGRYFILSFTYRINNQTK